MSKRGFEVRNTFDTLFGDVELLPSAEKTLKSINFDDLAQVLRHDAKAVYVYATWAKNKTGCEYRGELLFPFPATLLQSAPYMIAGTESGIITIASYELWLTDDMRIVVISNFHKDFNDGELISEYRTIKTDEQDEFYQVYEPDYNLLVLELWAMSMKRNSSKMPTYEL